TGIDDEILDACDDAIEIPMFGVKHSLNVSVAAGIAIFEAVKIYREIEKM
ncbi:MAG TPA: TrmH family RNA methyltransferase, partial [Candidatus Kapabacteria bacterium]|nr:TrmH family RNA methyltransferase [Candidatus Kapabacteria bacterium]